MKHSVLAASLTAILFAGPTLAADKDHAHGTKEMKGHDHMADAKPMKMAQSAGEMADGEIKRISKGSKKLTIKHGEIKNLDMPPMTMSFGVSDEKMLELVKKGDKVKFKAESVDGKMVVTEIMPQ